MNRRDALHNAALLAFGTALGGCSAKQKTADADVLPRPRVTLPPVDVSRDRVIRTVVGLRPFRPPGFRVERESLGRKTLVHNYGHGGGGITLSWGSAHLAVEELYRDGASPARVAVLGSGVMGLSAARLLQRRGVEVTIYAKELPPHTTSNIAAGQWAPASVYDFQRLEPAFEEQFGRASRFSYRYFQTMVGERYGIRWLPNYVLSNYPFAPAFRTDGLDDLFPQARELDPTEHPFPVKYARHYLTMFIEPSIYLDALLKDFLEAGGRLVVREFESVQQVVALPQRAIVNCTGLGARDLFDDQELMPVKGQLTFLVPQPEIDYLTLFGELYMMPRRDGILLGGTHERGEWSMEPNEEAIDRIVNGHQKLFEGFRT